MAMPKGVPQFNEPIECQEWCMDVAMGRVTAPPAAKAWAIAQLHAYRFGNWPGTNEKPKPRLRPAISRFDYTRSNSESDPLKQVLRQGSRSSGRKITLPKISKGVSDED